MRNFRDDAALRPQPRRDGPDDWATPADLIDVLINNVMLSLPPGTIWEPAPGAGALVDALEAAGHTVIITRANFMTLAPPLGARILIGNPPFNRMNEFAARGFELLDGNALDAVAWLWRWDHLPTQGRVGSINRAFAVHCCSWRPRWIPGSTVSPRFTFAWITWLAGHNGPPRLIAHERPAVGAIV